jgi:hypothetical protein
LGSWAWPVKQKDFISFQNKFLFNAEVNKNSGKILRYLIKI